MSILQAVEMVNVEQKKMLFQKITAVFGSDLTGRIFDIWGLSFKPKTEDIREAPAIPLIKSLLAARAKVRAYDPVALEPVQKLFSNQRIGWPFSVAPMTLTEVNALVLVTEWPIFRRPDFDRILSKLKTPILFDGRNQYDPAAMRKLGIKYCAIGHPRNG